MPILETPRERASLLIVLLAAGITVALSPFVSGLFGAGVLYVIFHRPYRHLERVMRSGIAAAITLLIALLAIALPLTWLIAMVIVQAPDSLQSLQQSSVLARIGQLGIGGHSIGTEFTKTSGAIISWLSTRAFSLAGSATSAALNLVIAFFGLYYMLRSGGNTWAAVRRYVPFSPRTADALRDSFFTVTEATLLGTVLIAVIQGALVGAGFWLVHLSDPLFWGTVTAFTSILPVLGSGIVWLPATLVLLAQRQYGSAVVMLVAGAGIASNVDNLIRPFVYKRVSNIHPMITLVGAFAGVKYFGLLGLLLGPLAIAYLFELLHFYREEYDTPDPAVASPQVTASTPVLG
jgi:predicted PurR-regulated permease PerM